jgi:hypothetical protein
MSIAPDDKDWTWVLRLPCPECGLDAGAVPPVEVPGWLRANADAWVDVLGRPGAADRTVVDRWSPLEYACHVRDVFTLFATRLRSMLEDDDATFANWDQDATAEADRYGEQDPAVVSDQLVVAAVKMADDLAAVTGGQWERTGRRSDGAQFTVSTFAQYLLHDPVHHLWDVTGRRADGG